MRICRRSNQAGYALLAVLLFTTVAFIVLAGVLEWCSSVSQNTQRHNLYFASLGSADSVLDKVSGRISEDYLANDQTYVDSHLDVYRSLVPTSADDPAFANFSFSDLNNNPGRASVDKLTSWSFGTPPTKYTGLWAYYSNYRIAATVVDTSQATRMPVTVQQELQLVSVPIFEFGVFYGLDLEICPSGTFTVSGRTHGNRMIYMQPTGNLTFRSHVTAAQKIVPDKSPEDPVVRTASPAVTFQGERDSGVNTVILPIGTNNTPDTLHGLVEIPPSSESLTSPMGKQRYYNKADLIIRVTDTNVVATSGAYNGFSTTVPWLQSRDVVETNAVFFNKRQYQNIRVTEIDIKKLNQQYSSLRSILGRDPRIIFIADQRTAAMYEQPSVRLVNGQTLPSVGLTVVTPNPIYIKGQYNVPKTYEGTTNTVASVPASIVADAVTILSENWNDNLSYYPLSFRRATSTTINACFITGIVPTGGGYYSGGLENAFRLLEDWNNRTLTLNGSIAVLFDSRIATAPWGASPDVYNPPIRNWNWDPYLQYETRLPPGTPAFSLVLRGKWSVIKTP
ncbi:MAG: hypothetical protein AB1813_18940 [Verrucomicrobiota bacterium]